MEFNMIYAILKLNSKQFIVKEGDAILIDYQKNQHKNNLLILNSILCIICKDSNIYGNPYVENYKIEATIIQECLKDKKVRVFKKKRRKGYHKTIGHRQKYTKIKINKISKN
jgi:large subunit ribosomal protein L21